MSMTTSDATSRAILILNDAGMVRWTADELMKWFNDARREIATLRPDLYAIKTDITLVAGAAQSVPDDGMRLIDVTRNADGSACTVIEKESLDQFRPRWQKETGSKSIRHFMMDERYPTDFWVYPPAAIGAALEIIYQPTPTDVGSGAALSTSESMYLSAIVDYMCFRAFSKDVEFVGAVDRAAAHYGKFKDTLSDGGRIALVTSPNAANRGGQPSRIATGE